MQHHYYSVLKKIGVLYLFVFIFLGSFQNSIAQSIEKDWNFSSITDSLGNNLFEIDENDTFSLSEGVFSYNLKAKDSLKAYGDYIYQNNLLVLFYNQPNDTIRRYRVTSLTESSLVFSENNISYSFSAPTQTELTEVVLDDDEKTSLALDPNQGLGFSLQSIARGALGMVFLLFVCYLLSSNRRKINWRLVLTGLALQLVFAILVLKVPFVATVFDWISDKVVTFLNFSEKGAEFLFGGLVTDMDSFGYIFAFKVLPTIVFFSAFTSLLYYLGILQLFVKAFAWVMSKTMRLSGAESLAAAANIFIGQTEAPLVVKPYLDKMTKSEMLCLMVGGMATIAGGVLAAFIAFLGGDSDAEKIIFAKHLLTASIMSAPAAILIAKMLYPETEEVNRKLDISKDKIGSNILDAISRGTSEGVKLAVNVGAMLLVFTAVMAVFNWITVDLIGAPTGLNDLITSSTDGRYDGFSLQYILGNIFAPVAWIIGVPAEDITVIGQLLGEKTILNEFFAYASLSDLKQAGAIQNYRSIVIATYALCGFANFASIGIQIGGIGVLAPSQRTTLAKFGIKALIGGTVAALLTATIAGMLIG
ncbi:nucleoside transporter C-terminal domain-containing protein [Patiriisocius hiemis]|uniref:Nucleoside transporter C-terminal domain-containing protein n=1 Tax=Patiriisocius hiemis TaxID=3075604 RepID=A0ABU2YCG7_9FLAO|nr:nucleoside transporter C-terminal domain-containing protein [Constantimarinum sp. W242]MDT0555879.1 nucleoside transporter C-terminal domain-containing protein [Constantimarinum sp. W242]